MDLLTVTFILSALSAIFYIYSKWNYNYWKRKGIPQMETEFFWGNIREQFKEGLSFGDQYTKFYKYAKSKGYRHIGIYRFSRPTYMPVDLEIIKNIIQKDFNNFVNHGVYMNEKVDPLSGHLFNLEDEKWKKLRGKYTPTFTSGKMKMMFPTLVQCSLSLEDVLKDHAKIQDPVDIKDVFSRYTTDVIGSCGFGIDCNSLKDPNSEFRQFGKRIFNLTFLETLKLASLFILPRQLVLFLKIKQTPVDVENFFINMVKDTVKYREENNIYRKDFMHLLLQIRNKGQIIDDDESICRKDTEYSGDGYSLTVHEIAAQCYVFFVAGFETSASTMSFALLELAQNQDIQDKLRKDIVSTLEKHNGQLTYEALLDMTYLDQVIHETLRRHPPFPGMPRVCNKEYTIPGTNITLEPKTRIHIPIQAIQRDPEYFPDPDRFIPERFSEENKRERPTLSFLAFGEGPRMCIGARFGLIQAKVGLIPIIKDFRVTLNEKTKLPIKYESRRFVTNVQGGVWLNVTKISE